MHPLLESALSAMGISDDVPTLRHAADFSERIVTESRAFLEENVPLDSIPLDVVAVGSIARREASTKSDFDYLIVAHALPPTASQSKDLLQAVEKLRRKFRLGAPGSTGMFGKVIAGPDLTERIGLQEDTNLSHSRRILLLEESVSLYQPERHRALLTLILDRDLDDYDPPKAGVPRFLLNDVIRYWRTLAVDYQAKRWEDQDPKWGLRYLKLVLSRKLAFAGTLVSLFLCERATAEHLVSQFEMPPLARLAQVHDHLTEPEARESLRQIFLASERFAKELGNEAFRSEAEGFRTRSDLERLPRIRAMRDLGNELQQHLERVFFESSRLGRISRKYLSF